MQIDRIGVDAPVVPLGTAADGSQRVPEAYDVIGWWKHGAQPAAPGNTVVVGHTYSAGDGVFDRLGDIERGAVSTVHPPAGTMDFTVTRATEISVEDFATVADDIYRSTGPVGLVVMTCEDFDGEDYAATIIVDAAAA